MTPTRIALVTGGGRGIGAAAAVALGAAGAHVHVLSRTAGDVERVVSQIRDDGGSAEPIVGDILTATFPDDVDILVSNAAILKPFGTAWTIDTEDWHRTLLINAVGAQRVLRHVMPGMLERDWGRIVAVSSVGAAMPTPFYSSYGASKAAFEQLHAAAAIEVGPEAGVKINILWPGPVDTHMQELLRSDAFPLASGAREVYESGNLRSPEDVASRIVSLCAEDLTEHGSRIDLDAKP